MIDPVGDHFKALERDWRSILPANEWIVIRVDGRAFHTYTRGLEKPFSEPLMASMDHTATVLAREVQGAVLGYVQSDEISIVVAPHPLGDPGGVWFGGSLQKIASISASAATGAFNSHFGSTMGWSRWAMFDARVFPLADPTEVDGYLRWRQADCTRNAISMLSEHYIGKKKLKSVKTGERVRLLAEAGVNVSDVNRRFVLGGLTYPVTAPEEVTFTHKQTLEEQTTVALRRRWVLEPTERVGTWFREHAVPDIAAV
jgi:tRNA(His) guanylyltransferase